MIHFGGIEIADQLRRRLLPRARPLNERLFGEPIFVATFSPAGKIHAIEVLAAVTEAVDDSWIGNAIQDHGVDLVAERLGEPGDVAIAAPIELVSGFLSGLIGSGRPRSFLGATGFSGGDR